MLCQLSKKNLRIAKKLWLKRKTFNLLKRYRLNRWTLLLFVNRRQSILRIWGCRESNTNLHHCHRSPLCPRKLLIWLIEYQMFLCHRLVLNPHFHHELIKTTSWKTSWQTTTCTSRPTQATTPPPCNQKVLKRSNCIVTSWIKWAPTTASTTISKANLKLTTHLANTESKAFCTNRLPQSKK